MVELGWNNSRTRVGVAELSAGRVAWARNAEAMSRLGNDSDFYFFSNRWFSPTLKSIPFIHRLPGLSSAMFDDGRRCSTMFGDVRRCSAMFDDVRRCSTMFGDVRRCSARFGDVIRCSAILSELQFTIVTVPFHVQDDLVRFSDLVYAATLICPLRPRSRLSRRLGRLDELVEYLPVCSMCDWAI